MTYYIVCPGGNKTGGTELAHQLVYKLNNLGAKAIIAYYGNRDGIYLNHAFEVYVKEYVLYEDLKDDKNNTIIFTESLTACIPRFVQSRIFIWWMSVDNYYNGRNLKLSKEEYGLLKAIAYRFLSAVGIRKKLKKYLPLSKLSNVDLHLAQSKYAEDFLIKNGISNIKYLTDYINTAYITCSKEIDISQKENIVLYNPNKGRKFTRRLIEYCKDIRFVPLANLMNDEVIDHMRRAKIYIDFGNHPGKDRLPREAAMMKCCIVTGRRGSAAYYEDIPINDKYKIEETMNNLEMIKRTLVEVMKDYETVYHEFDSYRSWISKEEERFDKEIQHIFIL